MKFSVLMNMKMPTLLVVGIFIFISRENFMLSSVEHEKRFITLEPGISNREWHRLNVAVLIK